MDKEDSSSTRSLSKALENVAKLDANVLYVSDNSKNNISSISSISKSKSISKSVKKKKHCPPEKELNKRTRRCIKRCPGLRRNGRCVRAK